MPFPENVKFKVKEKSHQTCCICKKIGIEIHHIIPQEAGGEDTFENAAPLCPSCHEIYGQNPTKRKFITDSKKIWYQICETRFQGDNAFYSKIFEQLKRIENGVFDLVDSKIIEKEKILSLGGVIDFLYKFQYPKDENEIINFDFSYNFIFELTADKPTEFDKSFYELRSKFKEVFGELLCHKLIIYLLNRTKINWLDKVSEKDVMAFIQINEIMMFAILMNYDSDDSLEKISISLVENDELKIAVVKN